MPAGGRGPRLDARLARGLLPFAGGMSGIGILGTILTQMDKVVLSRFLSLTDFGYYTVAGVVAGSLQLFITPIFSAVFPRLSALVAKDDREGIRHLYHAGTQAMAACVLATATVTTLCAPQLVAVWTGNPELSARVTPIAVLLLVGTAINGLMHLPFALQLAHGWTRVGLQVALCQVVIFVPALIYAAAHFGALGGAAIWALLNIFYLVTGLYLTHRRLLQGEMHRWIVRDVGYPLLASLLVGVIGHHFLNADATGPAAGFPLGALWLASLIAAGLTSPDIRASLFNARLRARLFDV